MSRRKNVLPPVHAGEVLREEYMNPLNLSACALAKGLGVVPAALHLLLRGRRDVSAELALRLARYVGTTAEFWMGLQGQYDLDVAQDAAEERIAREVHRCPKSFRAVASGRRVLIRLAGVDEKIVVPAAKRLSALVNPDPCYVDPKRIWQPADCFGILRRLHQRKSGTSKLRIDFCSGLWFSVRRVGGHSDNTIRQ